MLKKKARQLALLGVATLTCLLAVAACSPRTALAATDNWTNTAGGLFFTGANWSSNPSVPGNADTAVFNLNNTYTVQFNSGPTNTSFLMEQGNVTWEAVNAAQTYTLTSTSGPTDSGGTLTLGATSVPALTVDITGGFTVDGTGSPVLAVTNNTTLNAATIDLGDNGVSGNTGTINDSATITQSGSSTLTIGAASLSTGTLNVTAGTYTTGTGLTTINAKGALNLKGGTLNLNGGLTVTGGSLTQTAGTFSWAGSQTMTVQSGGAVSLLGFYETPTNAVINVTGAGSKFSTTGSSADLDIFNGATLSVTSGGSVHSDEAFDIASVGNGTVTVDGTGSSLTAAAPATAAQNGIGYVATGSLTFSNSATGSVPAGFIIGALNGSNGTLNVQSGATLTTGRLDLADEGDSTIAATALINVTGGTLTQSGTAPLLVGDAVGGSATVTVGTGGTFTTGTGTTTLNATGAINVTGGTLNANGNITVAGGLLNQTSGTFNWASSQTMTIESSGDVRLAGAYTTPASATINVTGAGAELNDIGSSTASLAINSGTTVSVTSGGTLHSDQYLNIGVGGGNGTVTVDGSGSSFSSAATASENTIGAFGNTGALTFSNSSTGTAPGGFRLASGSTSSGTLTVESSAALTTGPIDVADNATTGAGAVNVTGGTLTQSGAATLTVGEATGGTAIVNVGNATTSGTFTTGTGLTTIDGTGKINLTAGAFNLNGGLTVTGGAFTQTGGTFTWAGSQTMTIQSGGNVTLTGGYIIPTNADITVTGAGSTLSDTGSTTADLRVINGAAISVTSGATLHSDQLLDTGGGSVSIDGASSSLTITPSSTPRENFVGNTATASSLTLSNSATGNVTNGFLIGNLAGSNGTLNVQSSAILNTGSMDIADQGYSATGVVNVTGGTLTQSGASTLSVGQAAASGGTATVNVGSATTSGTFTTGTGLTTIGATGEINLTAGAFNLNGGLTVTGGAFTQTGGTFNWAGSQTMTIQSGGVVSLSGGYLAPSGATIDVTGSGSQFDETGTTADLRLGSGPTVSVTSGASIHSDQFLDIGYGTVTVDGAGSSFSAAAPTSGRENFLGNLSTGSLTFSNSATGSVTNGFLIGNAAGSSGTLDVQSNAALTTGPLDVADQSYSATGVINVTGGTLTQTGTAALTVGQAAANGGTATVTVGTGGTFTTGTGLTTIGATGNINLTAGTFNLNGGLTATGGAFTQTGGTFTWAGSQTMTVQSGGNVSVLGSFFTPASATIDVTGNGSQLNNTGSTAELGIVSGSTLSVTSGGTVNCNEYLLIDQGTVTVDGAGSSLTASAPVGSGQTLLGVTGTGSLTFSNSAIGSVANGFVLGLETGSSGTLNVESSATLTTGPLDVSDQGTVATGVINVTGGTLTQSASTALTIGQASGGTGSVTIGTGGTFNTSGRTTVGATGTLNLQSGGTLNVNGSVTNAGNITLAGTQFWAPFTTLTNTGHVSFYTDPGSATTSPLSILDNAGSVIFRSTQHLASLGIAAGATATDVTSTPNDVLVTGSLSITGTGSLDLTNNDMIVHHGSLSSIQGLVDSGYNNGAENGTGIITSSGTAAKRTLGVLLNDNGSGEPIYATFDGQSVTDTDVLVKYTLFGDANLDGTVDAADFVLLSNNFGKTGTTWSQGNFNDDGTTDAADFVLLSNNFGQSLGSSMAQYMDASQLATYNAIAEGYGFSDTQIAAWDVKLSGVPEPAMGVLVLAGLVVGRRRRR